MSDGWQTLVKLVPKPKPAPVDPCPDLFSMPISQVKSGGKPVVYWPETNGLSR